MGWYNRTPRRILLVGVQLLQIMMLLLSTQTSTSSAYTTTQLLLLQHYRNPRLTRRRSTSTSTMKRSMLLSSMDTTSVVVDVVSSFDNTRLSLDSIMDSLSSQADNYYYYYSHQDVIEAFSSSSSSSSSVVIGNNNNNNIMEAIQTEDAPFQYLFMFPTMALVATCCQLAGIGGAALLSPIFLLIFPLLGPTYPLPSAGAAIATALLTEVFGFMSGLTGYARRGLVDWGIAFQFVIISLPSALVGAVVAASVAQNPLLLRSVYAALMISLALFLTLSESPEKILEETEECNIPPLLADGQQKEEEDPYRRLNTVDGTTFVYLPLEQGNWKSAAITASGSGLTGLLGVGVGEVILPQLVRSCCMPLPVAAGTSVAVVVVTALTAAIVQFLTLASAVATTSDEGGGGGGLVAGLIQVVPWNLVQFTIPGAIVGGQIAPLLANRQIFTNEQIETFAATLFATIGIAFAIKCILG